MALINGLMDAGAASEQLHHRSDHIPLGDPRSVSRVAGQTPPGGSFPAGRAEDEGLSGGSLGPNREALWGGGDVAQHSLFGQIIWD